MHEVQKYITETNHGYIGYVVVTNKKFWDGLPADVRTALEGAMKEATAYERQISQKENDEALEGIRAAKKTEVYALPADARQQWRAALLPVHQQFEGAIGKDLLQEIYKISEKR